MEETYNTNKLMSKEKIRESECELIGTSQLLGYWLCHECYGINDVYVHSFDRDTHKKYSWNNWRGAPYFQKYH